MAGKGIISSLTDPQIIASEGVTTVLGLTSGSLASASQAAEFEAATAEAATMTAAQSVLDAASGYQWGLFPNATQSSGILSTALQALGIQAGTAIFPTGATIRLGYSSRKAVSTAPLQAGSFTSFNQVSAPRRMRLTISFQGTIRQKKANLTKLDSLHDGLTLLSVVMPEARRKNMKIVGLDYDRAANLTADLILADLELEEIRVYAVTTVTTTKTGTATSYSDQGTTQTQTPTSTQASAIGSAVS